MTGSKQSNINIQKQKISKSKSQKVKLGTTVREQTDDSLQKVRQVSERAETRFTIGEVIDVMTAPLQLTQEDGEGYVACLDNVLDGCMRNYLEARADGGSSIDHIDYLRDYNALVKMRDVIAAVYGLDLLNAQL